MRAGVRYVFGKHTLEPLRARYANLSGGRHKRKTLRTGPSPGASRYPVPLPGRRTWPGVWGACEFVCSGVSPEYRQCGAFMVGGVNSSAARYSGILEHPQAPETPRAPGRFPTPVEDVV